MGMVRKGALRLACSVCLAALTACSGGGGGGGGNTLATNTTTANNTTSGNTTSGNTTSGNTTSGNTTPTVSIGAPDNPNVTIASATFNFTTNPPPIGTEFPLLGPAVKLTSTTVEAANKGTTGTLTYRGLSNGVPTFDVSIPALGLSATNVRADRTTTTANGGGAVLLGIGVLNYTADGIWGYTPGPGTGINYVGVTATGSGTPIANVPTSGSANYTGVGGNGSGTVGVYYVPSGNGGISTGALHGNFAVAVNFGTGAVTGSLSNMQATASDGTISPWNDVALSANINRLTNNASFIGTTSTSGAPAGAGTAGFSGAATGGLGGAFFGPNVDEVGGTWTLTDPNAAGGGKTAFGAFGATSSGCSGCSTSSGSTTTTPTPSVSISPPGLGLATFGGSGIGTNFTTDLPPVGTVLPLGGSTVTITPTSVANFSVGSIQATFRGTVTSGGLTWPVFDLSIPSLSLTASNVRGDGTDVTLADGGKVNAKFSGMNYTLLGGWSYTPASGSTSYLGQVVTGYATPTANVPTSGNATYTGTGTVIGAYFVPSGANAIQSGTISGDASLNVNFSSNATNGNFTNMQAKALGSTTTTPWNDISLSGSLSKTTGPGAAAFVDGSTTTTGNTGAAGFSSAARGNFHGALYGPAAQEVGGAWTLSETSGGGKAAFGTFGATTTP